MKKCRNLHVNRPCVNHGIAFSETVSTRMDSRVRKNRPPKVTQLRFFTPKLCWVIGNLGVFSLQHGFDDETERDGEIGIEDVVV